MVDFLILINEPQVILDWLATHGIEVNRDSEGVVLTKAEAYIGETCTPIETDELNGNRGIMIRFIDAVGEAIPIGTKTEYIKWRSDEIVDGQQLPLPEYNVEDRGENGVGLGTYHKQTVARIAT